MMQHQKQLLIGPLPYVKRVLGALGHQVEVWAPDYSYPGVAERIEAEGKLISYQEWCYFYLW